MQATHPAFPFLQSLVRAWSEAPLSHWAQQSKQKRRSPLAFLTLCRCKARLCGCVSKYTKRAANRLEPHGMLALGATLWLWGRHRPKYHFSTLPQIGNGEAKAGYEKGGAGGLVPGENQGRYFSVSCLCRRPRAATRWTAPIQPSRTARPQPRGKTAEHDMNCSVAAPHTAPMEPPSPATS